MNFAISFDGISRMLRAEGFGYWDEAQARGFHEAMRGELSRASQRRPFTVLIDISRLDILPQNVVAIVVGTAAMIDASQASRVALVSDKALGRLQSQRISARPAHFQIHSSEASALAWLAISET